MPPELSLQSRHHLLRDHLEGRTTRNHSSASPGQRAGVEFGSDPVRADTMRFLRDVQEFLIDKCKAPTRDGLVVVAPPETLPLWREVLEAPLRSAVWSEGAKNLVRHSAHEPVESLRRLQNGD